jgi:hypothetical protein
MHLNATRWPERETRNGHGRIATRTAHYDSEFVRHWAADYDWRRCEAKPDGPRQFITEIDGLDIRFIQDAFHVAIP